MSLFFTVMAHMDAGAGLVTTDVDRFRLFRTAGFCHDILRKINEDRTWTARAGDIESFFADAARSSRFRTVIPYLMILQVMPTISTSWKERHAVIIGSSEACHQVSGARATGHQTDAGFSRGPGIGICLVDKRLFVAGKDNINPALFVEFIAAINGTGAGIGYLPLPLSGLLREVCFLKAVSNKFPPSFAI